MDSLAFEWATFSLAGRESANQDSIMQPIWVGGSLWTAIADGVGGAAGGREASSAAINVVKSIVETRPDADMADIFSTVRRRLVEIASENSALSRLATTLTVAQFANSKCTVGHVGDTRLYHVRGEGIVTVSKDQTEVQRLIDEGILKADQARRYPRRNVLLSSISPSRSYELMLAEAIVRPGDRVILTTDGVHGVLKRREIRDLSLAAANVEELSMAIRNGVESRGVVDDYSCVVLSVA